ncbi:MAG: YibE/F family protein [Lachnospiraceae bacterium]|nr:YibE/F family protein [Lachnospiraceae bacterium]
MKKQRKHFSLEKINNKKASIIVLAVAGVIFFGMLFWLYSEDILHGAGDIFWVYGEDELVEFEKGRVLAIQSDDKRVDEVADGAYVGTQELLVAVKSGRYKGEEMTVYNYFGPLYGVPVEVGDSVTLTIKTHIDGKHSATVYEFNRIPVMGAFLLLFFGVTILVGGRTGLKSLIGLTITVICLFAILIPLLLKGAPTILTTFLTCAFISVVCFTILGGVHRKTISAFLGTISGAFLAMLFGLTVQRIAKIDGLRLEDAEPLLQLKYAGDIPVHLRGLLVAGVIISALGAVMDVAMSISSSLEEVHAANPSLARNELFKSGMNIGRDMVGTMTNTLILAFLGSEFTLMIFLYSRGLTFYHLFSTVFVTLETISGLASSIGMILAIPLTALISATLIAGKKKSGATKKR